MQELLSTFHVDVQLIVAQLINFTILMVLIVYTVVKPLRKMMQEREDKIRAGVDNAIKAETLVNTAKDKSKDLLKEAKAEAHEIKSQASVQGDVIKDAKLHEAQVLIIQAQAQSNERIERERKADLAKFESESAELFKKGMEEVFKKRFEEAKEGQLFIAKTIGSK